MDAWTTAAIVGIIFAILPLFIVCPVPQRIDSVLLPFQIMLFLETNTFAPCTENVFLLNIFYSTSRMQKTRNRQKESVAYESWMRFGSAA